ncbi:MAG TPA: hypothetical protein VIY48_04185 [Candidatus Paceibacterota bacterium]
MTLNSRINKLLLQAQASHLKQQVGIERKIKAIYSKADQRLASLSLRGASLGSQSALFENMTKIMQSLSDDVTTAIEGAIKQSVRSAVSGSREIVDSIERVATRRLRRTRESIISEASREEEFLRDKIEQIRMSFDEVYPEAVQAMRTDSGVELSTKIWDINRMSLQQMKNFIAEYMITQESAGSIYRFVKGFLTLPDVDLRKKEWIEYFKDNPPGRGVYRSAWKNALRVIRTETNRAFRKAQAGFAKGETWVKGVRWVLSGAHPEADVCDDIANADDYGLGPGVYPAEAIPDSGHPQCLCHYEYVIDYAGLGLPESLGEEDA